MARLDSSVFPALSESVVAKLHSRNIFTVYDFMLQTCNELMQKTGLSFKEIQDMKELFFKNFGGEVINPVDFYEREICDVIPTGIKNLDILLNGGLHCRQIYEICGISSAGKSQLCHWISMHASLNTSTEVHYIDASRNFYISRIQMILEAKQCTDSDIGKVMSNIRVHRIHKINDLFTVFYQLSKRSTEPSKKLLIVDSLSVLCAIISNTELNPILSNFVSVCRYLINHVRATVIIVNTVRSEHGGKLLSDTDKNCKLNFRPSLGTYWLSIPNVRLLINHIKNKQREISIWKSCQLENEKSCLVDIKDEGIFPS